ncbi:nucleotidyl transferase AbiEii/AbiGii toxin family protein [Thioalkalivibrio sp. XN8]|uniref:nucleotidyl transferase AbiEii/AbiGii toxin family protein n=1 Tax=Thioalkalivibrio sp. XN8 TaxID=2712863 RepID=UPI0013ED8BBA|nr:nucleotidyl transferase AbiEii/AbiGii toxin family protein [Thioalkalivibrio sp. XN8]NGP53191.1 nucleotidyl transferase AbiEii/AbiGii toxin family protein [Thioalkalivibrio sp. XN8]
MTFLSRVCRALDDAGVRYAVVGGYAVALHGAVRGTVDIDFVLRWTLRDLEAAEAALGSLGLVSRLPVTAGDVFRFRDEYLRNRNLIAWNFYHPQDLSEQVDIVISEDLKGKRRVRMETLAGPVQVLSRKDLVAMKRASGRPQDLADVEALEKLG